jgi:prevent-host-death family protein
LPKIPGVNHLDAVHNPLNAITMGGIVRDAGLTIAAPSFSIPAESLIKPTIARRIGGWRRDPEIGFLSMQRTTIEKPLAPSRFADVTTNQYHVTTCEAREPTMNQSLVSIRELKSRLSHYLRLALSGESVVITDRGVPIGRIVPIGRDIDQRLAAMREAGLAQWSGQKLRRRKPIAKLRGRKTVAQLLVEERE